MQVRVALAGDVLLGRGIDQIQRSSVNPELRERFVGDARDYIALAERRGGTEVPRCVDPAYVWGDTVERLERFGPQATLVNLENALTDTDGFAPGKEIHYRGHPDNVAVLKTVPNPVCTLANNHVLDFGTTGLEETCAALDRARVPYCGAGRDGAEATGPAIVEPSASDAPPGRRVAVIGCCLGDSGVPPGWGTGDARAGVFRLPGLGGHEVEKLESIARPLRDAGALIVVSIHWGGNWGYDIAEAKVRFARSLADRGIVDVIHGHSSHHPQGFEIYRGVPVLYGCGDLINDYEGIKGHEEYEPDLALVYLVTFDRSGEGPRMEIAVYERRQFRLVRAREDSASRLAHTLSEENRRLAGPRLVYSDGTIKPTGSR